jgi:oligoendopeptidase F
MAKLREETLVEDRWNVEALYPNFEAWEADYNAICGEGKKPRWPAALAYKGRLKEGAKTLKAALDLTMELDRKLSKLYTYAHLRHDEEIANDQHKTANARITAILHEFNTEFSWFDPELLALPDALLADYLKAPELKDYHFHLEKVVRMKPHTLPADQEALLALAGRPLDSFYKTFNAISDADFRFGTVLDGKGQERELTHGTYGLYIRDQDRVIRENAFRKMHKNYQAYENTLAELIAGQVNKDLFYARARGYKSCLESALYPKNIDTAVYYALIKAVNEKIDVLHRYVKLRKELLGVDKLHLYDMYVPLIDKMDITLTYLEAEEIVIESVAPLGADYQNLLKKGLKSDRWVDRFENKNKRSGAYSSGCYDSMPYILMNYKKLLKDVFTLAHEAGHSMHSLLTHQSQPYQYGNYPIFLAEVASTFNEELLMQVLLGRAKSKEEKIYLINEKIEDIRGTLFRQTMFAEFELLIHENAERNIPLTPSLLNDLYRQLNAKYFGPLVTIDSEAEAEWARIPHFYYNFYVFQYATGISAALALSEKVLHGGSKEREDYLSFLKAGSSDYPIDILAKAGVDMRSPAPVKSAIDKFESLVQQLETLTGAEKIST